VGYARGRDRTELDRHSAAIRRACSERGWTLDRLVREGGAGPRRPGLVHALRHVADGAAARLVVDQVEHLGSTPAELAARLAWCARNHVDVVVLDVGLDTGTSEGRVAARCLLAIGGSDRPAPLRRAGNGRAGAATGAPARAAGSARSAPAEP
jgi:DNA invertase Pin-like site-specific DNA recombinase